MGEVIIRNARIEDAAALLDIFRYYIENTAVSFEYEPPALATFEDRMRTAMKRYPYLVAEQDGAVVGYAYAHSFIDRASYDWTCEVTIYLAHTARKSGIGRKIYTALEEKLKAMGILKMYACISYPEVEDEYATRNSADFHGHMGFVKVGEFRSCGYKFGRWYHMIWMEKVIGTHMADQPPITPYTY